MSKIGATLEPSPKERYMLHEVPVVFTSDGVPLAGIFVPSSASDRAAAWFEETL